MIGMSVRKLSVALDGAVAASAKREGVSLSAWLDRAAREALASPPAYSSAVNCRMSP